MKWQADLEYNDSIKFTSEWYYDFYKNENKTILDKTLEQISEYEYMEKNRGLQWTE